MAASTTPSRATSCGEPVITETGVGKVKIGMTANALRASCQIVLDTLRPGGEGEIQHVLRVAFPPDYLDAEIVNDSVWRLDILTPGIRTADSLGVGTALHRLLQMSRPRGASGEGRMFVMSPDHCGRSFEISYFGPMPRGGWTPANLARLPDSTHVVAVLVSKCYPELY